MEEDVLKKVIETEKEIQKCLELERTKSLAWLEGIKKESEEEIRREEEKITESLNRSGDEAKREAGLEASRITEQAARKISIMTALKDETLSRIVGKHSKGILPG
jgi:vacuolar-type H+-ATPase subunit H